LEELDVPRRNLKYSTDWHLLTRQNSYNASKQKRHNANDTNQFIFSVDPAKEMTGKRGFI
jgi:hypothetical protein